MSELMVTIPAADYRRLIEASEGDDMIVRCQTCGAWLTRDEAAPVEDYIGCWKVAVEGGDESTCRSYRATVLEGLPTGRSALAALEGGEQP